MAKEQNQTRSPEQGKLAKSYALVLHSMYESTEFRILSKEALNIYQAFKLEVVQNEVKRMKKNLSVVHPWNVNMWWVEPLLYSRPTRRRLSSMRSVREVRLGRCDTELLQQVCLEQGKTPAHIDIKEKTINLKIWMQKPQQQQQSL